LYYCEVTHTTAAYPTQQFVTTYVDGNGQTQLLWRLVGGVGGGGGAAISGVTLNGTIHTIYNNDGTSYAVDLNSVIINNVQYSIGITNHAYQLIQYPDFSTVTIGGTTFNRALITLGDTQQAAKLNYVVVDLTTTDNYHHLVSLPNTLTNIQKGIIYKVIVKLNNMSALDKKLILYSTALGGNYRIISPHNKTLVGTSYFLSLDTAESLELLWDGSDFIVVGANMQEYVSHAIENYNDTDDSGPYIIRDLSTLLS
jgi:hypothetical protein